MTDHDTDPYLAIGEILAAAGLAAANSMCGTPGQARCAHRAVVYRWRCPWCDPKTGREPDGHKCEHCFGSTFTNDVGGWDESELTPASPPPAVMRRPCGDCAFRPGSPEDLAANPDPEVPFFCHHGLPRVGEAYSPPALVSGMPLGAFVCAGWWAVATGRPLPVEEFRDPGGSDRIDAAPLTPGAAP